MRYAIIRKFKEVLFPKLKLSESNPSARIPALDGLRGLAIASVLIYHCSSYLEIGWAGVDLFFVLSGFLLTGILLDSKHSPTYFKAFYIRRALRILPLYYLLLTCAIIYSLTFNTTSPHFSYLVFLQNFNATSIKSFPLGTPQLNHLWSIAVEEQFYLVLPFIIFRLTKSSLLKFFLSAIGIAIVVRTCLFLDNNIGYYVSIFSRIDALCLGSITAVLMRHYRVFLQKWTITFFIGVSLFISICIVLGGQNYSNPFLATGGYTAISIFFGCLIVIILSEHPFNFFRLLTHSKLLRFLGKYSFGLYMYQWPITMLGSEPVETYLSKYFSHENSRVLTAAILFSVILITCIASYHLFEKRFLDLKKSFAFKKIQDHELQKTQRIQA